MTINFITGNKNKFSEAKEILGEVNQIEMDLPEIQEIDPKKIIKEKLKEARKAGKNNFFCEDTSLYIESLQGLPGPLIKWFLKTLKPEGIYKLVKSSTNKKAVAKTIIGYYDGNSERFFEGEIEGEIVEPKGETNFGWDPLFKPKGYNKTFAEMPKEEKNKISMRKKALIKLNDYVRMKNRIKKG